MSRTNSDISGFRSEEIDIKDIHENYVSDYSPGMSTFDILLWRSPLKSAAILMSCLTLEISLICFSVISVLAYGGLTFLIIATSLRIYFKFSGQADENLIQSYLDRNISVGKEQSTNISDHFLTKVDGIILKVRSLLLIEDYFESLKLGVFLYVMTYIGAKFNFMTLCIIVTLIIFSVPKVYQLYQVELDNIYRILKNKVSALLTRLMDKASHVPVIGSLLRTHRD